MITGLKYRAEIDGLRALAVLPVILFHAGFEWFSGGFVGVDVFFVISGYLITTLIVSELSEGKFSLLDFYERRARRILPGLFIVMLVSLPFAWFLLTPSELKDFGQSLFATSTFVSNVLFWIESGYFETTAELKPLLHTWSLAVEEQYYLLFPIFMIAIWQFGIKWTLGLLILIFLSSLGLAEWAANTDKPKLVSGAYFLLPTRVWELLIGVFVALWLRSNHFFESIILNQLLSVIGALMIGYSILFFDADTPFPSTHTLVPVMGTALLILCCVKKTALYNTLTIKPLVGLGLASYSAYLWHQPVLAFARHALLDKISDVMLLGLCGVSLLLAWLSYRYVEMPFRDRSIISSNLMATLLLGALTTFAVIGLTLHLNNGFEIRISHLDKSTGIERSPLREACHTVEIPCEFFESTPKFATFGDSHVVELSYALAKMLQPHGFSVQQNSYSSCPPKLRFDKTYCSEWSSNAIEGIVNDTGIEVVIVSYSLAKTEPKRREIVITDLIAIIKKFTGAGKKVYFLSQPPLLNVSIQKSLLVKGDLSGAITTRQDWLRQNSFVYNRHIDLPEDVVILDAADVFCDDSNCYAGDSGGHYYYDDNHISLYGAGKIVEHFSSHFTSEAL
jgi:peptidoglycan/LPS O-acetylase OafA/YrhL